MLGKFRFSGGVLIIFCLLLLTGQVLAAAETGEYLKYQDPQPATPSWLATSSYIISFLLTFLVVLALAYFTSRFLAQRMPRAGGFGNGKVYTTLFLGPNRAVYVVEIAGKIMVLGVTEHNISLLGEITSSTDIEQLKAMQNTASVPQNEQFSNIFQRQLISLKEMHRSFPLIFGSDTPKISEEEVKNDSRKR